MNDKDHILLERLIWALAVAWTLICLTLLAGSVFKTRLDSSEVARIHARDAYEKDVMYRLWNAKHGGIYVPVTETTQPNPYLSHLPERDITTPSGKALTLMNPAYMTRQVHELAKERQGILGHITSLKPIRPENAPDPWEEEALKSFEVGESEVSSVEKLQGKDYMRLMRPLVTKKECLKCHAQQGYQEGDIRGGISVSVPMEPLWNVAHAQMLTLFLGDALLWLIGLGGIGLGGQRLRRSEQERRRSEAGLRIAKKAAEQANLAKSEFLANMSHELRTPLNAVIGFSEVLVDQLCGPLNEKQQVYIENILTSGRHLLGLIDDILDLSKVEAGKMELELGRFPLKEILNSSLVFLREKALTHNINLSLEVEPEADVEIEADQRKCRQILFNLLSNALKFTPDGGSVSVQARKVSATEAQTGGDWVEISVVDTGLGIKPEDMPRLFKAFSQLESPYTKQYEGTGLGLALTRKFVELHGGRIWAEGEFGKGSRFAFVLPLSPPAGKTD